VTLGDGVVKVQPATRAESPLGVQAGIFQRYGFLNADTTNLVYRQRVTVFLKRTTEQAANEAILAIQAYVNAKGDMEIREDADVVIRCRDWYLEGVAEPDLAPAFGSRFTPGLDLIFAGERAPEFP